MNPMRAASQEQPLSLRVLLSKLLALATQCSAHSIRYRRKTGWSFFSSGWSIACTWR